MSPAGRVHIFICTAIRVVCLHFNCPDSSQQALRVILSRIHPYVTLHAWVRGNVRRVSLERTQYDSRDMHEFRLRWLDALIAEFEAKGD